MKPANLLLQQIEDNHLWERELSLSRNEFLKVAGSVDTNVYFVKSGSLRVFVIDKFEEHTIRFGYQNNLVVALDSYITGKPSGYYIQALKKTELKVTGKNVLKKMTEGSPELQKAWIALLEQIIFQQLEREQDILISSPLERYKRVLQRSPQLFQEIPNKYIASYLSMTPETLSRIKKH